MLHTNLMALTSDQLMRAAPAVFATAPHPELSDKYSFLRTADVVQALTGAGWSPVQASQGRVRLASRGGLQRHAIRFRHADLDVRELSVDGIFAELLLTNSHDGTSAFRFDLALHRKVCSNGLIVSDGLFARIAVRHSNVTTDDVVNASFEVVKGLPRLGESVSAMRSLQLTGEEQNMFARAAAYARWGDEAPSNASALLTTRRSADAGASLWNTFNRVQENIVRGGVRVANAEGKRKKVRAINSVNEDTKLNKALWTLAEEMKRIKTA